MNAIAAYAIMIPIVVSVIATMGNKYYPNDKSAKEKLWKYAKFKGAIYALALLITIVVDIGINQEVSIPVLLEILLMSFDMIETISDAKSEQYNDNVEEESKAQTENGNQDEVIRHKRLRDEMNIYFSKICNNMNSDYHVQPSYEIIHEYLKYYPSANELLKVLYAIAYERNKDYSVDELWTLYDSCMEDIQFYESHIIKYPGEDPFLQMRVY